MTNPDDLSAEKWAGKLVPLDTITGWYEGHPELVQGELVAQVTSLLSTYHRAVVEACRKDYIVLLKEMEFILLGKCPICLGWDVIKGRGECFNVHRKDCRLAQALAGVGEEK